MVRMNPPTSFCWTSVCRSSTAVKAAKKIHETAPQVRIRDAHHVRLMTNT